MKRRLEIWLPVVAIVGIVLGQTGCSNVVVSASMREQTEALLANPQMSEMFPRKLTHLELAAIDGQTALPEFGFDRSGYRGIYQASGQQVEVFIYRDMTRQIGQSMLDGLRSSAEKKGYNLARFRQNNGSWTWWSGDGRHYRVVPRGSTWIVFRSQQSVNQLPVVKDFARQARL